MAEKLSIFDVKSDWLKNEIYVHGVKDELDEMAGILGGRVKAAKELGVSYKSRFAEWVMGRAPIPLKQLEKIIDFFEMEFQQQVKAKINAKSLTLSCVYSPHKILFQSNISEDMAYLIGAILGDGSLAGENSNDKGNWGILTYFDNEGHMSIFNQIVENEFSIKPKICRPKNKNHFVSYFCSKPLHWYLRSFFEMHNGYKASKIMIPKIILNSKNDKLQAAVLQGLFDTDGTITKRGYVQYASTSKRIIDQVSSLLNTRNIVHSKAVWLKAEKYLPLYSIAIRRKSSVINFAQRIGFRHPLKAEKLAKYSPVV
ncbi:MAG: hypothetical protein HY393_01825 [Candidatus Diapherotrites archaeon]|nr:hypothetical protein [Candidatus Diapherotrites archaeon]